MTEEIAVNGIISIRLMSVSDGCATLEVEFVSGVTKLAFGQKVLCKGDALTLDNLTLLVEVDDLIEIPDFNAGPLTLNDS